MSKKYIINQEAMRRGLLSLAVLLFVLVFSAGKAWGQSASNQQDFSTTKTWPVPSGVYHITVEVWGAGGGGGGARGYLASAGGGGGGGYAYLRDYPVEPGDVVTVTIGNGGTGGRSWYEWGKKTSPGGTGGQTSIKVKHNNVTTTIAYANGGSGASSTNDYSSESNGGSGGTAGGVVGTITRTGGNGGNSHCDNATGSSYYSGGGGGCAARAGNGGNASGSTAGHRGTNGNTDYSIYLDGAGATGRSGRTDGGAGRAGNNYGGGGSGGYQETLTPDGQNGGAGAQGYARIRWVVTEPHTVTFNLNGGSGSKPTNGNIRMGQKYSEVCGTSNWVPTRTGYTFKGWCVNNASGNGLFIGPDAACTQNAAHTVYAIWEQNLQTVLNVCPNADNVYLNAPSGYPNYSWSPTTALSSSSAQNPKVNVQTIGAGNSKTYTCSYNDNFTKNYDFSLGNTCFYSDYTYSAPAGQQTLVPEGLYTICTNSNSIHHSFSNTTSYEGDNGYFMVVNGSDEPSDIVWEQTIKIEKNTNYTISTRVTSVGSTSEGKVAQLSYFVNGTEITNNVFNVNSNSWMEFKTDWNSGNNNFATIQIKNMCTALGGNDFGIDHTIVTTKTNISLNNSVTVNVYPEFSAGTISSTGQTILNGGTPNNIGSTTAASGGDGNITYKWQVATNGGSYTDISNSNSATFNPASYSNAGTYKFRRLAKDNSCAGWTAASGEWMLTIANISNVKPKSREYVACPNEEVQIDLLNLEPELDYAIYTSATGNTYSTTDHHRFKKTNSSTEVAYVQILANGSPVGDRIAVNVLPSDFCGSETDQNCDGLVLFYEDFGGNDVNDPQYSSTPNPNVNSSMEFAVGVEAGSGKYGLTKHAVASYCIPDNTDHTHLGDQTKGYFMMIDPTDGMDNSPMYETTISNLCSGSPLTFSFWASELHKESDHVAPPKFDLQLINPANNEVLVQSSIWTPAATDQQSWHQYGLRYTVPSDISSVKFRISNRSNAYVGNDYRIDDIKVIFCGGTITQNNTSPSVCAGSSVSMTNTVNLDAGSGITSPAYKWQYSTDGSSWQTISGANTASYTISSAQTSNAGFYRMFVANSDVISAVPDATSCMLQTPDNFHLTVVSPSVGGTVSSNQTICSGGSVSALSLSGNTGSVTKWQYSTDNSSWTDISNTTTTLPAASMSTTQSRWYRAVVKNGVCAATNSSSAKVSLYPEFSAGAIASTGETICKNGTPSAIGSSTNASGGDGNISYQWYVGSTPISGATATTYTPTQTEPGTYTFTRKAKDGSCVDWTASEGSYTLTIEHPQVTVTPTDVLCYGESNGKLAVAVSGGTPSYTIYNNSTSAGTLAANGTFNIENLAAGNYTIMVEDAHGCQTTLNNQSVSQPNALTATITSSTQETCTGNDGKATVTATGGNGGYTYAWSNSSATTATAEGLTSLGTNSGVYTVTVTDSKSCTASTSVTITLNNPLDLHAITIPPVCSGYEFSYTPQNGTDGTLPTGTTYSWPAPDAITGISGLAAGENQTRIHGTIKNETGSPVTITYAVTPKNGVCVGTSTNASITIESQINPLVEVEIADQTVCPNNGDLLINASFTNVNSVHDVVWKWNSTTVKSTSNIAAATTTDSYTIPAATLAADCNAQYTLRVEYTDASGCTASDDAAITVKDVAGPVFADDILTTKAANIDATQCKFTVPDLTADVRAKVSDNCTANDDLNITQNPEVGAVITESTDVTVTVSDQCGKQNTHTIHVTVPDALVVSISSTDDKTTICNGDNIDLTAATTGGTGTKTYAWTGSSETDNSINVAPTTNTTYSVTVTDANNCTATKDFELTVNDPQVTLNDLEGQTICNGSSTTLTASVASSNGDVTYQWSNGLGTNATSGSITTSGTYYVTATATTGSCTKTDSKSATVSIYPSFNAGAISSTGETINHDAAASEISATTAAGGDGNFSYQWYLNTTAVEGANAATYTPAQLEPGTYTITRKAKDGSCADWTLSENSYVLVVLEPHIAVTDRGNLAYCSTIEANESFIDQNGQKVNRPAMSQYGELLNTMECGHTGPIFDTITFIPNGGTGTMTKQTVTRGVATAIKNNAYTHPGNWTFVGWNDDCDGNGNSYANQANITTNGNVTLYAQWHTWCTGSANTSVNENGTTSRIDSVKDHQNNWYEVVQVGSQCWLKENMRCTTSPKTLNTLVVMDKSKSDHLPKAYYYDNDNSSVRPNGLLYNWYAAVDSSFESLPTETVDFLNRRGICPEGWHVPSNEDWNVLEDYLVGSPISRDLSSDISLYGQSSLNAIAGGCRWAEETNPEGPGYYDGSKRNSTGLSIVPTGYYCENTFHFLNEHMGVEADESLIMTGFQAATYVKEPSLGVVTRMIGCGDMLSFLSLATIGIVHANDGDGADGYSVRCIRD